MTKLEQAFTLFDQYNQQSPEQITWKGEHYPSEYFYALKLYDWVKSLDQHASEALLLASRCQHIGRWEIERKTYPEGRVGYLTWRSDLAKHHAQKAVEIMSSLNYEADIIAKVREIVLKRGIKRDRDVQTIENALCLVFLEFQYDDLLQKHSDEKMISILQKTWAKMSEEGQRVALTLQYSDRGKALLTKALGN
jgi:hypothetical protein